MKEHSKAPSDLQQLPLIHPGDVLSVDQNLARVRTDQPDEVFEQNTLAAAAAANHDDRFSRFDAERNSIEHAMGTKALYQVAHFDHSSSLFKTSVRKKLLMSIEMEEKTTASVVARPTPSAPSPQVIPL